MTGGERLMRDRMDDAGARIGVHLASQAVTEATAARVGAGRRRVAAARTGATVAAVAALAWGAWSVGGPARHAVQPASVASITEEPLETQLRDAITAGDHDRMLRLIALGAYVDEQQEPKMTMSRLAMEGCDTQALAILDAAGASRYAYPLEVEDLAVAEGFEAGCPVDAVMKAATDADPIGVDQRLMESVAWHGTADDVRALAAEGVAIENRAEGWTALWEAGVAGSTEQVEALLALGADPQFRVNGGPPVVEELRDAGAHSDVIALIEAAVEEGS